jgi:prevent-host-death family protein
METAFKVFSVGQARAKLRALISLVQKEGPIVIAEQSTPVAVMISIEELGGCILEGSPRERRSRVQAFSNI